MKKMIKRVLLITAAILLIAGSVSYGEETAPADGNLIVRVGFVYPKTGDLASFGEFTEEWTDRKSVV